MLRLLNSISAFDSYYFLARSLLYRPNPKAAFCRSQTFYLQTKKKPRIKIKDKKNSKPKA
jgi:hypothetical protein